MDQPVSPAPSPSPPELRRFGLAMGVLVALFLGLLVPWLWGLGWPLWPWAAGAALALAGLLAPTLLAPLHRGWMALGHGLGWVNTRIILGLVFFLLFVPVGLAMRPFRDPLARRLEPHRDSYRQPTRQPRAANLGRPF